MYYHLLIIKGTEFMHNLDVSACIMVIESCAIADYLKTVSDGKYTVFKIDL